MKYLYYTKSVLSGVTYENRTRRKEIVKEEKSRYILKEYGNKVSFVLKNDMMYYSDFDFKAYETSIETLDLLEKYNITELEAKYSLLLNRFLNAKDHDVMRNIVNALEGILNENWNI